MNTINVKKVAVVTSASTAIGVAIIKHLRAEGYYVLGVMDGVFKSGENLDYLLGEKGLDKVVTRVDSSLSRRTLTTTLTRRCGEFGMPAHIDLLVNIPNMALDECEILSEEQSVNEYLRQCIQKPYGVTNSLVEYLEKSYNSKVVYVYPEIEGSYGDVRLAERIVHTTLSTIVKHQAVTLGEKGISVSALTPRFEEDEIHTAMYDLLESSGEKAQKPIQNVLYYLQQLLGEDSNSSHYNVILPVATDIDLTETVGV